MSQRDVVFPAGRRALYERNRYSPAIRQMLERDGLQGMGNTREQARQFLRKEFTKWDKRDGIGFICCCGLVGVVLLVSAGFSIAGKSKAQYQNM